MFKEKNSKKRLAAVESSRGQTLDARHQSMLDLFESQTEEWKRLQAQLEALEIEQAHWKRRIEDLQTQTQHSETENIEAEYQEAWNRKLECADRKIALERRLGELHALQHEVQYFERTGKILFDYYDLLEKQESTLPTETAATTTPVPAPNSIASGPAPGKSILEAFHNFFKPEKDEMETITTDIGPSESVPAAAAAATATATATPPPDKRSLVEQYMAIVEPSYIRPQYQEIQMGQCENCQIPLTYMVQDGITICHKCGFQELLLVEQNKPIYRQPTKEASHFSYKRINHFNEWISQIQGKESTDIPEEIFEKIIAEIKKEKIQDTTKITYKKMRDILKKLQVAKYYEHLNYILARINNQPTPNFTPELEEKLRTMFKEIQGPFLKHCPKDRKNFLSYSYVLYKFFQLLEKDEFLRFFPMLKSREKLHLQDQIWKNICAELSWQFIESI